MRRLQEARGDCPRVTAWIAQSGSVSGANAQPNLGRAGHRPQRAQPVFPAAKQQCRHRVPPAGCCWSFSCSPNTMRPLLCVGCRHPRTGSLATEMR